MCVYGRGPGCPEFGSWFCHKSSTEDAKTGSMAKPQFPESEMRSGGRTHLPQVRSSHLNKWSLAVHNLEKLLFLLAKMLACDPWPVCKLDVAMTQLYSQIMNQCYYKICPCVPHQHTFSVLSFAIWMAMARRTWEACGLSSTWSIRKVPEWLHCLPSADLRPCHTIPGRTNKLYLGFCDYYPSWLYPILFNIQLLWFIFSDFNCIEIHRLFF